MKKTLQLILAFLVSFATYAQSSTYNVGGINYTVTNDTAFEVQCDGYDLTADPVPVAVDLVIPETIDPFPGSGLIYTVTSVGLKAFSGTVDENLVIETVTLPSTVTTLGEESFGNLSNLTTINLDNVEVVGKKALVVCGKLANVGSMEKVVTIGDYAFNRCVSITNYQFSSALTSIGVGAIYNSSGSGLPNYGPETINIPSSVTAMGTLNFGGYGKLKAIQVNWASPADVTISGTLSNFVRWKDRSTVTVYVPAGKASDYEAGGDAWTGFNFVEGTLADYVPVLGVGDYITVGDNEYAITSQSPNEVSFAGTTSSSATITIDPTVTLSDIPYAITAVGSEAFKDNTTVTEVVLPTSVTTLQSEAFSGATNLESINLDNITTIESQNAFYNCTKMTHFDFPALTDIGNFSFYSSGITSINFPNVVNIGRGSFGLNSIPSINIPASVETIATKAFISCNSLTEIQVNWTDAVDIPVLDITVDDPATTDTDEGNAAFHKVDTSQITLYVPTGTTSLYQAVDGWKDFNIVEGSLSVDDILSGSLDINVTSDVITVNSSSVFKNTTLSIYDITGRLLVNESVNGASASVNISGLASGIYIVKVAEGNAELVKRFTK